MELKDIIANSGGKVVEKTDPQGGEKPVDQKPADVKPEDAKPVDQKPADAKPEDQKPADVAKFEISSFNKTFESEYESEDTIRELLSNGSKYKTDIESREDRIRELSSAADNAIDPMSLFASEDEYVRQQFLKNNKDKYNESSLDYLTNLSPSKIDKLDSWDALTYQLSIEGADTLEGGKAGVEAILKDKYGIDEDTPLSEVDQLTKNKIALDSKKAKESLKSLYSDIKIPEKVDWESRKTAIKDQWDSPLRAIVDGITEIQVADGISLSVDDSMKEGLFDSTLNGLVSRQVGVSEDAASDISGDIRTKLFLQNTDKIVKVIQADAEEKAKAKYRERVHNDKPLSDDAKGDGGDNRSLNDIALEKFTK